MKLPLAPDKLGLQRRRAVTAADIDLTRRCNEVGHVSMPVIRVHLHRIFHNIRQENKHVH